MTCTSERLKAPPAASPSAARVPCGRIELLEKLDASPARGYLRAKGRFARSGLARGKSSTPAILPASSPWNPGPMLCLSWGPMRREDIGAGSGWREMAAAGSADILADGGSCVAGPDGEWVVPPASPVETLPMATLDHRRVVERQNFDPSGHLCAARCDTAPSEPKASKHSCPNRLIRSE